MTTPEAPSPSPTTERRTITGPSTNAVVPPHDEEYAEYFAHRQPVAMGERLLSWWHARMLDEVARLVGGHERLSPLFEVGTGWSHFARACSLRGLAYSGIEMNGAQADLLRTEGLDVVAGRVPPLPRAPVCRRLDVPRS